MNEKLPPPPGSDAEWNYFMDATQTILQLEAGQVLTAEQVAEIQFVSDYERRDHEHRIDVFHNGYTAGQLNAAGAEKAALLEKVGLLQTELAVAKGLLRFHKKREEQRRKMRPGRALSSAKPAEGESLRDEP